MAKEPCAFVGHAQHAAHLMRGHAFLAGGQKVHRGEPDVDLDVAAFHQGANGHRERLAAFLALVDAGTRGLAHKLRNARLVRIAAMGAYRAMRPMQALKMFAGLVLVGVDRVGEFHGTASELKPSYKMNRGTSSR